MEYPYYFREIEADFEIRGVLCSNGFICITKYQDDSVEISVGKDDKMIAFADGNYESDKASFDEYLILFAENMNKINLPDLKNT